MGRLLFIILIGLGGLGVLVGLGVWQVQRLAWKQEMLGRIEARIAAAPTPLPAAPDAGRDQYQPVGLDGAILGGELHVLVSSRASGPGYRVIVPFLTDAGRRLLLDRGFVPVAAADIARPTGAVHVVGNLHWPDERSGATPPNDHAANVWFARDIAEMAATLETEPLLVVARSDTGGGVTPWPVGTAGIPNDHMQYAITWFSLALVWAGMTGLWLSRIRRGTGREVG